jgi:hypothetical protein
LVSFFTISAYLLTGILIIILTKEVIDGTKKESSVLKTLGYGNYSTTSLVMDGQGMVMVAALIIALPLAIMSLGIISGILESLTGLKFFLGAQTAVFIQTFAILMGIFALVYILAFVLFRTISPLLAMRDN